MFVLEIYLFIIIPAIVGLFFLGGLVALLFYNKIDSVFEDRYEAAKAMFVAPALVACLLLIPVLIHAVFAKPTEVLVDSVEYFVEEGDYSLNLAGDRYTVEFEDENGALILSAKEVLIAENNDEGTVIVFEEYKVLEKSFLGTLSKKKNKITIKHVN